MSNYWCSAVETVAIYVTLLARRCRPYALEALAGVLWPRRRRPRGRAWRPRSLLERSHACPRRCARRWLGERRAGRRLGEDGTSLPLAQRCYWRRGGRHLWLGDAAARLIFNLSTWRLTAMIPGGGNKVLPVRGRKESYTRRCFFFMWTPPCF